MMNTLFSSFAMLSTIEAMKVPLFQPKYVYHKLFGAGNDRPVQLPDGSINCIIDGVDRGFHCLMRPKNGVTTPDSALYQNRNADLCYDRWTPRKERVGDKDDVHCHGSYESDLYRYVILDHLNRGYEGVLDCMCDCDVTTRSGQGRYETGSDDCKEGLTAQSRRGQYRWTENEWGVKFLEGEDLALYNQYLSEEGLSNRRRDGCIQVVSREEDKNNDCMIVEKSVNICRGLETIMTLPNLERPECVDTSENPQ
eukprot:Awhi_evm1s1879